MLPASLRSTSVGVGLIDDRDDALKSLDSDGDGEPYRRAPRRVEEQRLGEVVGSFESSRDKGMVRG